MSLQDSIRIPGFILLLAMTCFIGLYVWLAVSSQLSITIGRDTIISSANNATIQTAIGQITTGIQAFDYVFPIMVIGLMMLSLIFAYKSGAGVIYSILSVVFWAVALMFSVIYSNIFEQFITSFPTIASQYTIMVWILANMKWIVLGWVFLISIVMFTQNKNDSGGNQITEAQKILYGGGYR